LPLSIGRNGGSEPNLWLGKLDEVRLWNLVRTAAEMQATLASELTGEQPGLVGYWRFNEAAGTTARDAGGRPQDAELLGSAEWSMDSPEITGGSTPSPPE